MQYAILYHTVPKDICPSRRIASHAIPSRSYQKLNQPDDQLRKPGPQTNPRIQHQHRLHAGAGTERPAHE